MERQNVDKSKILIVDDQPENLQAIVDIFESEDEGYSILKAPNGKVALEIIGKIVPDIIITDWEMPEMNGIDLIKSLRKNDDAKDIPVIMCTGVMVTSENLKAALSAGANDYIRKPVDRIELLARTKANLHLAEKYIEIKKLNNAKDLLFSIISHDLRNALGNVSVITDLMIPSCNICPNEDSKRLLSHININTQTALEILANLFQWALVQRRGVVFSPKTQSLKEFINKNTERASQLASQKGITIIHDEIEELTLSIDQNILGAILHNLLTNAIKFTPSGGKIQIQAKSKEDYVEVAIIDNGVGMPQEVLNDLFKIDKRVSTAGTEKERGTGLGLILCKELIDLHGGKIGVESELNKGSTFFMSIPT